MSEPDISPLARRLAEENNVDWRGLHGSAAGGKVVERDVLEYLARVMAGEEAVDPTPEPVPEGMDAWPEDDVRAFQRDLQGSSGGGLDDIQQELSASDRLAGAASAAAASPPPWETGAEPAGEDVAEDAEDISEDIFLFEDEEPGGGDAAAFGAASRAAVDDLDDELLVAGDDGAGDEAELDEEPDADLWGRGPVAEPGDRLPDVFGAEGGAPEEASEEPDTFDHAGAALFAERPQGAETDAPEAIENGGLEIPELGDFDLDGSAEGPRADAHDGEALFSDDMGGAQAAEAEPGADAGDGPALWAAEGAGEDQDGHGAPAEADAWVGGAEPEPGTDAQGPAWRGTVAPGGASTGESGGAPAEPEADDAAAAPAPGTSGLGRADAPPTSYSLEDGDDAVSPAVPAKTAAGDAPPSSDTGAAPIGALPLVSYGTLLRRHLDLTALASAQLAVSQEMGDKEPLPPTAFLVRAAAKAVADLAWSPEGLGLARLDAAGVDIDPVFDGDRRPFRELLESLRAPSAGGDHAALGLVVADMSALDVDEAVLDVGAPVLTLGRILYDNQRGSYRSTLALSGEVVPERGAHLLARVAELLDAPVRLVL